MEVKEDEGIAVGSCRSIEGFNILNALQSMPELFVKFGGMQERQDLQFR